MSYDCTIIDNNGMPCIVNTAPAGGIIQIAGPKEAYLNITYNYSGIINSVLSGGISGLNGKKWMRQSSQYGKLSPSLEMTEIPITGKQLKAMRKLPSRDCWFLPYSALEESGRFFKLQVSPCCNSSEEEAETPQPPGKSRHI